VREVSADGENWSDIRSMTDLGWHVTQAAIHRESLRFRVSDGAGQHTRDVQLDLHGADAQEVDSGLMRRVGFGGPYSEPVMGTIKPGGAASAAGLVAGDRVLAVDGVALTDAFTLRETIRASASTGQVRPQLWDIERAGQPLELTVVPLVVDDGSKRIGRVDAFIGSPPEMVLVRYDFIDGLVHAATRTWDMSALTLKMFGKMVTGEASLKNLTGPITIADYAGQSVRIGLAYYLGFLAIVSISLGVLNLLPLPMLDGGHLMYHLFEAMTGRPVPELWLERLQRGGVAIMLGMMSIALFNDVARLLGQH
jgi:regulator of sigma E protease